MIVLSASTYTLQLILTAGTADVDVSYVDRTATAYPIGATEQTAATATTQTICSAPAASTSREIDFLSVKIKTTGGVVTIQKLNSSGSVTTQLISVTLLDEEVLQYTHAGGWAALDANGNRKEVTSSTFGALTATSITDSGLTSGRVVYSTTGGLLTDEAAFAYDAGTNALTVGTINAFTLGGTVSGGGNQINNVVIGAVTPLAGSFTTLAASGKITQTVATLPNVEWRSTNAVTGYHEYYYNTSTLAGVIGNSTGVLSGASASDFIVRSEGSFKIAANGNNLAATFTSTAATLPGTLSATGTIKAGGYTVGTLPANAAGLIAYVTDQLTVANAKGVAPTGGGAVVCYQMNTGAGWVGI